MKEKLPLTSVPMPSVAIEAEAEAADLTKADAAAGTDSAPSLDRPAGEPAGLPAIDPTNRMALEQAHPNVVSECPLAGVHILQTMERIQGETGQGTVPPVAPRTSTLGRLPVGLLLISILLQNL